MARQLAFMFSIGATLASGFNSGFASANGALTSLQTRSTSLRSTLSSLGTAQRAGIIGTQAYSTAHANLSRELQHTQSRLTQLRTAQGAYNQATANSNAARSNLGSAVMLGTTIAAPFIAATKTAANFDFEMHKVKAISGATDEEFKTLTDTAKKLGATTEYTAAEASAGMRYLAMAGFKTNQITAAMPPLLDLATAGSVDLARASDIVSDTMTAFGLSAGETKRICDVFAVTVTNTNTDVNMLGETMKYAAPISKAFGVSLEETSAIAGLMANAGIKASQAGTSLRSGMLRLAGPPKMAADALDKMGISLEELNVEQREAAIVLKELGISMEDANGPRKMSIILEELRKKMADYSNEQKLATAKAVFGTNAASGWVAVLDQGSASLEKMTTALENSEGAASKTADIMRNNAQGAMTALSSAIEGVAIAVGSTMLPALQETAVFVTGYTSQLAEFATEHKTATKWIGYAALGFSGLIIGVSTCSYVYAKYQGVMAAINLVRNHEIYLSTISTAKTYAMTFATKASTLATALWGKAMVLANAAMAACPVGWLIIGIAGLVVAGAVLYKHWDKVKLFMTDLWESPAARVAMFVTGPIGWLVAAATYVIVHWDELSAYLGYFWDNPTAAVFRFTSYVEDQFTGMLTWVTDKWEGIRTFLSQPIFGTIDVSTTGNANVENIDFGGVASNATGGIYNRGAFLTTFAENSPEAAIPIDGSGRAIELWQRTGEMLGIGSDEGNNVTNQLSPLSTNNTTNQLSSLKTSTSKNISNSINVNYSPQYYLNSNNNIASLEDTKHDDLNKLREMLFKLQNDNRRLAYD